MTIIYTNRELDKRRLYAHTRAQALPMKEIADGTIIDPVELVIYSDINNTGEETEYVSIVNEEHLHIASSSPTLIREIRSIVELMDGEDFKLKICKRQSKGGRTYTTCELV